MFQQTDNYAQFHPFPEEFVVQALLVKASIEFLLKVWSFKYGTKINFADNIILEMGEARARTMTTGDAGLVILTASRVLGKCIDAEKLRPLQSGKLRLLTKW